MVGVPAGGGDGWGIVLRDMIIGIGIRLGTGLRLGLGLGIGVRVYGVRVRARLGLGLGLGLGRVARVGRNFGHSAIRWRSGKERAPLTDCCMVTPHMNRSAQVKITRARRRTSMPARSPAHGAWRWRRDRRRSSRLPSWRGEMVMRSDRRPQAACTEHWRGTKQSMSHGACGVAESCGVSREMVQDNVEVAVHRHVQAGPTDGIEVGEGDLEGPGADRNQRVQGAYTATAHHRQRSANLS